MTPITREELFLAAATGENVELPKPITRKEIFLAKAAGMDIIAPEPVTREEIYLSQLNSYIISPSGLAYKKIDFLTFSGNQYINTGIKPTSNSRIEIEFVAYNADAFVFGSRKSSSSGDSFAIAIYNKSTYPLFGSSQTNVSNIITLNNKHKIALSQDGYFLDGNLIKSYEEMSFNSELNMYVGGCNQNGTLERRTFTGKIYSVKLFDNNQIMRNMKPCIRMSDSKDGMYDIVNDIFYQLNVLPASMVAKLMLVAL